MVTWSPENQAELASLQQRLSPAPTQEAPPAPEGLLGFTGKAIANIIPNAISNTLNLSNNLLGVQRDASIPTPFQEQAPQGLAQGGVRLLTGLAEQLPSFVVPELAGAKIASALGAAPRVAKIIGGAAGFGVPSAPQGVESGAVGAGVGALQTAAQDWGWKGKLAAGLIGGAAGVYEGAKTSPQDAALQGTINAVFPTVIDPLLNKLLHVKTNAGEKSVKPPSSTPAPEIGPTPETSSGLKLATDQNAPLQSQGGLQMFNAPDTSGMRLAEGGLGVPQTHGGPVEGQVWIGDSTPSGLQLALENRVGARGADTTQVGQMIGAPEPQMALAPGTAPLGLRPPLEIPQPAPISPNPLGMIFPRERAIRPPNDLTAATLPYDIRNPEKKAGILQVSEQAPISPLALSPSTAPLGIGNRPVSGHFDPELHAPVEDMQVASLQKEATPHDKLPTGLIAKLSDAPGWQPEGVPLGRGYTNDAFQFGKTFKTPEDVSRAYKGAKLFEDKAMELLHKPDMTDHEMVIAQEYSNKAQYLREAAQYAEGLPSKVDNFRKNVDPAYEPPVPGEEYKKWKADRESGASGPIKSAQQVADEMLAKMMGGGEERANPTKPVEPASGLGKGQDVADKMMAEFAAKTARETDAKIQQAVEMATQGKTGAEIAEHLRASIESGPGPHTRSAGRGKTTLTLEEGLAKLPKEAADMVGSIIASLQEASGRPIDAHLMMHRTDVKGSAYLTSGKVGLSEHWIKGKLSNWAKMSETSRVSAIMEIAKTFGHEITHVAQQFGERSGLAINGVPLLHAVRDKVFALSMEDRTRLIAEIQKLSGNRSGTVSKYLSGDLETIRTHYEKKLGPLSDEAVKNLAAGEFLAEVGSIELAKRAKINGLPETLRAAVDKFKAAIVNVISWLKGEGKQVAPLQDLSDMANKMFDHFAASDREALNKAFPFNDIYKNPDTLLSGTGHGSGGGEPPIAPPSHPSPAPTPPPSGAIGVAQQSEYVKGELLRLGARAIAGGAAGGIIAPSASDNQISIAEGVLYGGILGMFGPAMAKGLLNRNNLAEVKAIAARTGGNPFRIFKAIMNDRSMEQLGQQGATLGMTAPPMAKMMRWIEKEFGINQDPKIKGFMENAKGVVQEQVAILQDAFNKARFFKPTQALEDATGRLYEGKMSKIEFEGLLTTPEERAYGNWVTTASDARTMLSQMFAEGLPKSAFRAHILKATDSYLSRTYSAYREGKFNEDAFQKAKADLMKAYPEYTSDVADMKMREYQREIQANRELFQRRGTGGQKIDSATLMRRLATEGEIEAQQAVVAGLEHNPYGDQFKAEKAKLDWMQEHQVTDSWRDWLGEYKNPNDRIIHTVQKLYASSIASRTFSLFDSHVDSQGLKFAYKGEELGKTMEAIKGKLAATTDQAEVASLQKQLAALQAYVPLSPGSAFGRLSGKFVSRFVRDEMATYDSSFKWMDQPVFRSIAKFNDIIKINRTILNPLTVLRNYIQTPMFSLMAKAKFSDMGKAWGVMKHGTDPELLREMRQRHIIGADFVASELGHGPGSLFNGNFDSDVAVKAARAGYEKLQEFYRAPDVLVRAAAFISARDRFALRYAESTGMALADALKHEDVLSKAANFTERYTMNYSSVPRIVKAARQLPFFSLFMSYTSEITKILKNLAQDVIDPHIDSAGRMHAVTTLGAMAALPVMILAGAKGNLSEKDRRDWETIEKLSPDFNRTRFRIPTGRNKDGTFNYFDMTNLIPADAYTSMVRGFVNGDVAGAMAQNPIASLQDTPLLNIVSEQVTGKDRNTGQDIKDFGRVSAVLKEVLPPLIPPGYEGTRLEQAFATNELGNLGTRNLRTGVEVTPSTIVANYLTGMRFSNIQLETLQKQAVGAAMADIAQQQVSARRVLQSDANQQTKQETAEHLRKMSEEILKNLTVKLQS